MTIRVMLNAETFRRFTIFDFMKRRKAWKSPATFASIMSISACICFIMKHVEGAVMLGTVLLIVGLGMPALFLLNFHKSLKSQILANGLTRPQEVYTLDLDEKSNKIHVKNQTEQAEYPWNKIHHVYRDTLATYLFITPQRAFILPHTCVEEPEDLWALIHKKVPQEKTTDLRK